MSQPPNKPGESSSGDSPASPSTGSGNPAPPADGGNPAPPADGGNPAPPPGDRQQPGWGFPPPAPSGGFPPPQQSGGFPPQQSGGFPPQQSGGFPPPQQSGGFPPPQQSGGFPPPGPGGGYPQQPGPSYPQQPGWGFPPPPPGAGFPPPGAGFPPPPPGGYPPPPPPQGGYAPLPPGYGMPPAFSVGEAFNWAWNKFTKNAGPLIVAGLVFFLISFVVSMLSNAFLQAVSSPDVTSVNYGDGMVETVGWSLGGAGIAVLMLSWIVELVVRSTIGSAYFVGLLDIADGRPVSFGSFFRPRNIVAVVLAALLVGVATAVGLVLCILPGLAVLVFAWFTTVAIVDRNLAPMDGIRTSLAIVKANFGTVLLAWLVTVGIELVGLLACGVGLLVAIPVSYLFQVYTWRKLSGGMVAPAIG